MFTKNLLFYSIVKKNAWSLALMFMLTVFIQPNLWAQCPNDNVQFGSSSITCGVSEQTLTSCIFGGEYRLVNVTAGNDYSFATCGNTSFDTQITLYADVSGAFLGSNDDFCGVQSRVDWTATFTGQIRVLVDKYLCSDIPTCTTLTGSCNLGSGGGGGSDDPDNDDQCSAADISCGETMSGTTNGAMPDNPPNCETSSGTGGGVWYTWTGDGSSVTFSTCSPETDYDTKLRVYSGNCEQLSCVGGSDDDFSCGYSNVQSTVSFVSEQGVQYFILVHGFGIDEGNFKLSLFCDGGCNTADAAPVVDEGTCPGNITLCGAQNVSWTPPTVTDNCDEPSVSSNYYPGDYFSVGTHTVIYTFTDEAGLTTTCSFDVVINALPMAEVTQTNLPQWCQGIKVLFAKVGNHYQLAHPLSYSWSGGLGNGAEAVAFANGTYSVTVTDANNCSTEVSTTVNADLSTLLSAHTIITEDGLDMDESTVLSGGVGVLDGEEISIQNNTDITTFLRAANAAIDGSSMVADYINSDSPLVLPVFMSNGFNDNNTVYVPSGGSMTLSGSNYGNVTVGKNATLNVDNTSIYLKSLTMLTGATLNFYDPTDMMIKKKLNIGMKCNVNVEGPTTVIYVADRASVGQGSTVQVNIYAPEGLEVNDSGSSLTTYMTGMFIGNDEVTSGDNVVWGWNMNCSYPLLGGGNGEGLSQPDSQSSQSIIQNKTDLLVYPNPTAGVLNIDLTDYMEQSVNLTIYNTLGEVVWSKQIDEMETAILDVNLSGFANGLYYLNLTSNGEIISKQVVLNK